MGDREGNSGAGRCEGSVLSYATGAVQLILPERELEHRAAAYVLVKGPGPGLQPVGVTDCCLDRPSQLLLGSAGRFIELVPVGRAEDQDVDVPDGPLPGWPA
jgi:hypothetical protein